MILPIATLVLALTPFSVPVEVIVLRSGHRVAVQGEVMVEGTRLLFRSASAALFSLPMSDIDFDGTERFARESRIATRIDREEEVRDEPQLKVRVSPQELKRLLAELATKRGVKRPASASIPVPPAPPPPMEARSSIEVSSNSDEWSWRDRARSFEEAFRRAEENLQLLITREQRLNDEILGLLSVGYKPDQFSYQIFQLQFARESIEPARLDVERARRALAQFQDDARRQDVPPGWLR